MIPVLWHKGLQGNWDAAFPRFLLDNSAECDHLEGCAAAPQLPQSAAVICIPGQHSIEPADHTTINRAAANFSKITFIIYGDEEAKFNPQWLSGHDARVWWFAPPYPKPEGVDRVACFGWPQDCRRMIAGEKSIVAGVRDLDWCFLGQVTHERRQQCAEAARRIEHPGHFLGSKGFSQGAPRQEYYRYLCRSKIVLCPSGPCTPDSFRFAEAMEANCIPIADECTPNVHYPPGYWQYIFDRVHLPFPVIRNWDDLPRVVEKVLLDYPQYFFKCVQFWHEYKMRLVTQMREDLRR